ncbi:hypothetical protein [Flavobacterium sp. 2]|uniref:hypothetical protein n=1 Tax=Flavobacterium sp. 2 TaxID=308053 RepID=UPI003CF9C48A
MSTNYNRIKVADLETNEPNKILKTNANGELEFSNVIDNKQLKLASDSETQINYTVAEDEKVISRLKLFNWWEWLKAQSQTISGTWNFTNKVTLAAGNTATPSLIIPNGTLTNFPQNGSIERDSNGQLWETHNDVRARLATTSEVILIPFKASNNIQTNITGTLSATAQSISSSTIVGSIKNSSVSRLNLSNEIYFYSNNPSLGNIDPIEAKSEIYLKINNGLFSSHFSGISPTNQIKIIEFSGLNNNGLKNYQSPFLTDIQNSDIMLAQWSKIQFTTQNIKDGVTTNGEATYYLRDASNSRTFGVSEASFSFVIVNTVTYADPTNSQGKNISKIIRTNNYAIYLETIR